MNESIIIRTPGMRYEFWLHRNYDASFWNKHYVSMESCIPYHIAVDILNNPKAVDLIKERLNTYELKKEPLKITVLIWCIVITLCGLAYLICHIVFFALDYLFTIQSVVGIFITIVAVMYYCILLILTNILRRFRR